MTTPAEFQQRLLRAQSALKESGHAAFVAAPGADLRYLCGHDVHVNERLTALVVRADDAPVLVTPVLEAPGVAQSPVGELGLEIIAWTETQSPYDVVCGLSADGSLAVSDRMWSQHVFGLMSLGSNEVVDGASLMAGLRMVKSPSEVESLRRAAQAIDSVHARMGEWLMAGRTENAIAADLADAIREAGHQSVDFVIVGSGPHGASPHHSASERVIESGDVVVVDIGGTMPDGYCSDSTRTYLAGGSPSARVTEMYLALQQAQQVGRDSVRAGVSAESIDHTTRAVIVDAGFGDYFIHRTGHGIGMETHEPPYIVEGNTHPLQAGTAFSVEPGIYLPDEYGARIEDIVVATDDGVDVLNATPRDLRVLS